MSGQIPIFHFGFVETTHPAAVQRYCFWVERLVVAGPAFLPNFLIDLVEFVHEFAIHRMGVENLYVAWSSVIWVFQE